MEETMRYARVVVDQMPDKEFDYLVPPEWHDAIGVGSRVRIPFGQRATLGTVVGLPDVPATNRLRPISELVEQRPAIPGPLLEMARWMSEYYAAPLESTLRSLLPQVVRKAEMGEQKLQFLQLTPAGRALDPESLRKRAPRQADLLEALHASQEPVPAAALLKELGLQHSALKTPQEKGWITVETTSVGRDALAKETVMRTQALEMNPEQSAALLTVQEGLASPETAKPILLQGITGSGKTEIYLQAIHTVMEKGGSALVMVPEISLTPQTVERFMARFGGEDGRIAVLHSHLSNGERRDEWHKVHSGAARIVIGARSAIFAPLRDLRLIVVDEEHENSYKQEESPRYQARDLAVLRAKLEKCVIVLGSATPSMESYANARSGKYKLVRLTKRIDDRQLPLVRVVDLKMEARHRKGDLVLSEKLRSAITDRLEKKEQTILFLNRRGYSTSLQCNACGYVAKCEHCSVSMTYHRSAQRLTCHLCGYQTVAPKSCPECKDPAIRFSGVGTEKVEEVVAKCFPKATVRRLDADVLSRRQMLKETLEAFRTGKIDILVGTQMIAKGLDFPNVTLVGIINADLGLHLPDFRAGERVFQLLTQVAGRAGRGDLAGEVMIQSFTPGSPAIQFARHHDVDGFLEQEIEFREVCGHPPFSHLVLIHLRCPHQERGAFTAETLHRRLAENLPDGVTLHDPMPSPIERAKDHYRYQILMKAKSIRPLTRHIRRVILALTLPKDVQLAVDVDPYQLL